MSSERVETNIALDLPKLPDGWIWKSLSDLVDSKRGICYGIVQPGQHDPIGIPMVNTGDIFDGNVNKKVIFQVSPDLHAKFKRSTLRGGELLVTLVGANFGRVAIAPEEYIGHNCSRAVGVVPLLDDADFVMFVLRSPLTRHFMDQWANTTAQPTFNLKELGNLPIPIPTQSEKSAIRIFLKSLDDRITLLRETNTTLEAIAQALFKSLFVDFDPVHAKRQGCIPEGMDEATATLFPDSFEESELGLVPKGWTLSKIEDLMELAYGKALKASDRIEGCISVYGSGGITGRHNVALVTEPSIVIGRKGTVGSLYWEDEPFFPIDTVFYVKTSKPLTYCFYLLKTLGLEGMNTDGAVPGLNRNNVYRLPAITPSEKILMAFDESVGVLRAMMFSNAKQVQTLTNLRDTLLPRLISGALRLPEVEAC